MCLLVYFRRKNRFCPELLGVVACQLFTLDTSVQVTERLIFYSGWLQNGVAKKFNGQPMFFCALLWRANDVFKN